MPQRIARRLVVLATTFALMVTSLAVGARPAEVAPYGDPDAAARPFASIDPLDSRQLARLDVRRVDRPDDVAARSQRGWLLAQRGERARALADIDAAIEAASANRNLLRKVLWSAGWSAIALGDGALANDYWDRNLELVESRPFWVPYSRAAAHELLGDLDTAVAWYDLAAGVQPNRFATREALSATTRHWQPAERRLIDRVFERWQSKRGSALVAVDQLGKRPR